MLVIILKIIMEIISLTIYIHTCSHVRRCELFNKNKNYLIQIPNLILFCL
jgi:hypothetical protein